MGGDNAGLLTEELWESWPFEEKLKFVKTFDGDPTSIPDFVYAWLIAKSIDDLLVVWSRREVGEFLNRVLSDEEARRKALALRPLKNEKVAKFLAEPEFQTVSLKPGQYVEIPVKRSVLDEVGAEGGLTVLGGRTDPVAVVYVFKQRGQLVVLALNDIPGRPVDYDRDRFHVGEVKGEQRIIATVHGLLQDPPVHPYLDLLQVVLPDLRDLYRYAEVHFSLPPNTTKIQSRSYPSTADLSEEEWAILASVVNQTMFTPRRPVLPAPYMPLSIGKEVFIGRSELFSNDFVVNFAGGESPYHSLELIINTKTEQVEPAVLWDPERQRPVLNKKAAKIGRGLEAVRNLMQGTALIVVSEAFFV